MKIEYYTPENWSEVAADAHLAVFDEVVGQDFYAMDFALVAVHEKDCAAYATFHEQNANTVYMKHGGVFPKFRGTGLGRKILKLFVPTALESYYHLNCLVETTNTVFIKMLLDEGFLITGMRIFEGKNYIEMSVQKKG